MFKKCNHCEKLYAAIRSDQRFCSSKCSLLSRRTKRKAYEGRPCANCGKSYLPIRIDQRFCSVQCHDVFYCSRQEKKTICEKCGVEFVTTTMKRKYCSEECQRASKAARDLGRERRGKKGNENGNT